MRQPFGLWRAILLGAFGLVLLAGGGLWLGQKMLPDLISDFGLRGTAQEVADGRLVSGRCSAKLMLVPDCTLTLSVRGKDREITRQVHYLFVDLHSGSHTVQAILGDPARPATLTTDIGMDRLWNRAITLAVTAGLIVFFAFGILALARGGKAQRQLVRAVSGQVLQPAVLQLEVAGQNGWTVREVSGREPNGGVRDWKVAGNAAPFWLDPARHLILGVRAAGVASPMPLDAKLRWLDLTAEERAALQAFRVKA